MNFSARQIVLYLLGAVLCAAAVWWWYDNFEKRWSARAHVSSAARKNPMLAATRLLEQQGYKVSTEETLREAVLKPMPDGTLFIAESGGLVSEKEMQTLLLWVRRGNTLVLQPKWGGSDSSADESGKKKRSRFEGEADPDPIGRRFDIHLGYAPDCNCKKTKPKAAAVADAEDEDEDDPAQQEQQKQKSQEKQDGQKPQKKAPFVSIAFPDAAYPLQLGENWTILQSGKKNLAWRFGDDKGEAVRVYAEGRGHVVMLVRNYFDNGNLARYDHAETLLSLSRLGPAANTANPAARNFLIVRGLDMPKWYRTLWANFHAGLIGVGCLLLLLFWVAVRRFGPLLPEPDDERRSLLEHIDASGRWLWKVPGGRDILLNAARNATTRVLHRRAPELLRLDAQEQIRRLAHSVRLPPAELVLALHRPASAVPAEFTRQIQTLQQLRKSHER